MSGVEGFAAVARALADAARAVGLVVPAFRSPPRVAGASRTLRRYPGGTVISVTLRDRPFDAVVTDMVEGVVVANRLGGDAALRARTVLAESAAAAIARRGRAEPPAPAAPGPSRGVEHQTRAA